METELICSMNGIHVYRYIDSNRITRFNIVGKRGMISDLTYFECNDLMAVLGWIRVTEVERDK